MTSFASRTLTVLAMFWSSSAVACSSAEEDLCEAKVQCEGAADPNLEQEVCLVQADTDAEIAELRGCGDLYDQAIDCFAEKNLCSETKFRGGDDCKGLYDRLDACVGEPKTLDVEG